MKKRISNFWKQRLVFHDDVDGDGNNNNGDKDDNQKKLCLLKNEFSTKW